jgi:hypothetical protein
VADEELTAEQESLKIQGDALLDGEGRTEPSPDATAEPQAESEGEDADEDEDDGEGLPEVPEELLAEGGELLVASVQELSGDDVDRLLKGLPPQVATELVHDLIGNKLDPRRLKNLGSLLIGPLRKRTATRLDVTMERLSVGILESFHHELGDRFDNPSLDDLREVLDAVLAQHPLPGVRCTLSWVVAEGMPAAAAARDVLVTDERLRLPGWAEPS